MKKIAKLLLASLLFFGTALKTKADEGMWLPFLLGGETYKNMQECGIRLTPEQIYSVNQSSIKDAIVALGGGFCTGEIISKEGLMLTNHHCGYDAIQQNSTTDHDYLTDGFWAMNKGQEIPVDFSVWFLDKMKDVTDKVLADVTSEMSEDERSNAIRKAISKLKEEASEGKGEEFAVQVKPFYYGNYYYMFTYNIFNDVRLVGAPPSSIGKYGGDTDNWMWPRHTGDFSMFRIYSDKDNNPAAFAEDNIPYTPKHSLPISTAGVKQGDYAMILGYPGSTDRYLTSLGVQQAVQIEQPARVKVRRMKLDIMEEGMNKEQKVRIQYASKHASVSNYWKYFIGQSEQLVRNNVFAKKEAIEKKFLSWAAESDDRNNKYGNAIELVHKSKKASQEYIIPEVYFMEAIYQGPELFGFLINNFGSRSAMGAALASGDEKELSEAKKELLENVDEFYKNYNQQIDQNLMSAMLKVYFTDVPSSFHPQGLTDLAKKYKNNFEKFASKYYTKSPFVSKEKLTTWIEDKVSKDALEKDPVYNLANSFLQDYIQGIMMPKMAFEADFSKGMRLFVDGLKQMGYNKASDANSTMRVTFGNVLPYDAKDGVTFKHYTTMQGVMDKEVVTDDKNHEFYVPSRLKELHDAKDYGPYANEDGVLPVCFLSNNDITGGNSGSPVINADGELIGTAFDGNWEAMSGDIYFEPNIQRTISVDIRYTLFIIDKYAGAGHLVKEMQVNTERKKPVMPKKELELDQVPLDTKAE
ncbi:MAG: serine protease [Flavobacteriales bacterium]|nr:serine protease [Flavobacteriales bacterium]